MCLRGIRICLGLMLLISLPLARGATTLNFPRFSFDQSSLTGLAFVNPTSQDAALTLTAYGPDGQLIVAPGFQNPAQITVRANQQIAKLLPEFFNTALPEDLVGWVQATSPVDHITGFFLYLNSSITLMDGADLPKTGRAIIFNSVRLGQDVSSELNVFNPNSNSSNLTLELNRPLLPRLTSGLVLPSMGMVRLSPRSLFAVEETPDGSYLVVRADTKIGGFEFVRPSSGDLFGINAISDRTQLSRLYFPQLAVLGPWTTRLTLVNYSARSVILTVSALEGDGDLFGPDVIQKNPVVRSLAAGSSLVEDVGKLFGFKGSATRDGWLRVEATAPAVNGFISYGLPSTGSVAAVAAQAEARQEALFSHIATTYGYFTGVALLNPGTLSANFRVLAFDLEGKSLGRFHGSLGPRERLSKLIDELITEAGGQAGGFIWIKSDVPLFMTSLFGTSNVLANIPPQPVPSTFIPDQGQPQPKVEPQLAVLSPGGSSQFAASSFSGDVLWAVNGVTSGTPSEGRIDASGKYTAPATAPQQLPVRISAFSGNTIAGASVDVLLKEDLVSGLGIVQSVAYLSSLKRIYTAELSTLGTQQNGENSSTQQTVDSRIFAVFPSRLEIKSYANEIISKMIPFTASNGKEFLLLAGRQGGRVIRLDPEQPEQSRDVIQGLTAPAAMVLDPAGNNLLVADDDQIKSFSTHQLESGLTQSLNLRASAQRSRQVLEGFAGLSGIAADVCTGNYYVAESSGRLLEIDRKTGLREVLFSAENWTQLLGIYRADVPCPSSFHLLAASPETGTVQLVVPASRSQSVWLAGAEVNDLTFLSDNNTAVSSEAILLGEVVPEAAPGRVSAVPTPDLYESPEEQPPPPPQLIGEDPVGDTFGPGGVQHDIVGVEAEVRNGQLWVTVTMNDEFEIMTPESIGGELAVVIEIDADRDPSTGFASIIDTVTSFRSGLGVEYGVETEYDPATGTVPLYIVTGFWDGNVISLVPLRLEARSLTVSIPLDQIGVSSCVDLAVTAGYYNEEDDPFPTDVAPNVGAVTACASAQE